MPRARLWLIAAATLSAVAVAFAQPTGGTVLGRVRDWTGGILPGVSVTLFPERGGAVTHTTADSDGRYRFNLVPAGTYRVAFGMEGFDIERVKHVEVQPGRFLVRALAGAWSITAYDSGFEPVTMDLTGTTSGSLVFTLPSAGIPEIANAERSNRRTCYCPAESFVHEQR